MLRGSVKTNMGSVMADKTKAQKLWKKSWLLTWNSCLREQKVGLYMTGGSTIGRHHPRLALAVLHRVFLTMPGRPGKIHKEVDTIFSFSLAFNFHFTLWFPGPTFSSSHDHPIPPYPNSLKTWPWPWSSKFLPLFFWAASPSRDNQMSCTTIDPLPFIIIIFNHVLSRTKLRLFTFST